MVLRAICILISISILYPRGVWGQSILADSWREVTRFERITVRNGLPHDGIYELIQGPHGYLWIATEGGLCRYDGYQFKIYQSDPLDPLALSENSTGRMLFDQNDQLWLGTWGGGLNQFDPITEQFTVYRHQPDDPQSLPDNRIQSLCILPDQSLWIGTFSKGLARMDPATRKFSSFFPSFVDPEAASCRVWSIQPAGNSGLWLGTNWGLLHFDLTNQTFRRAVPFLGDSTSVRVILVTTDGHYWLGSDNGLYRFNPNDETVVPAPVGLFGQFEVRSLRESGDGSLWVGTGSSGLLHIELKGGQVRRHVNIPQDMTSLADNTVEAILVDHTENLWVGTNGGLHKTDLKPKKFNHYRRDPKRILTLSHNKVASIYQDSDRELWIGTVGGGLNRLSSARESISMYRSETHAGLSDNAIFAILEGEPGILWLGTYFGGLVRFDKQSEEFKNYLIHTDEAERLNSHRIRCLAKDRHGRLWIGTDAGLHLFQPEIERFVTASQLGFEKGKGDQRLQFILADDDRLWLAGDQGIFWYLLDTKKLASLDFHSAPSPAWQVARGTYIHRSNDNIFWLGTNQGVFRYDRTQKNLQVFTAPKYLPSNVIVSILEDSRGQLWFGTDRGLCHFNPDTLESRVYDLDDGLQGNGFNYGAAWKTDQGEFLFGGQNGFNSFFPAQLQNNPFKPPIVLTNLKILNQEVVIPAGYLEQGLSIPRRDNVITFEFAALEFTLPRKNRYRYKLAGFDKNWVDAGNERQATYTNLHPGNYSLLVQGSNHDQVWNREGLRIDLQIVPPWWQTAWAQSLYLLLLLIGVIVIPSLSILRLRRRKAALSRIVKEKTAELLTKNAALQEVNNELIAFDQIVHTINQKIELTALYQTILEQGVTLFPSAQKGAFLNYDAASDRFCFEAVVGYELHLLEKISLSTKEARQRYLASRPSLGEGVYQVQGFHSLPTRKTLANISKPKALLVMTLEIEDRLEGFLLFENFSDEQAFDSSDLHKLKRYREHAITAIVKVRLLHDLKEAATNLKETQKQLLAAAHQAGMAEIATNVLHNVGNTLNSINTSADLLDRIGSAPALSLFNRITGLLEEHAHSIEYFLAHDERGKKVPKALVQVSESLRHLYSDFAKEMIALKAHVKQLKGIVHAQKEYASWDAFAEETYLTHCIKKVLDLEMPRLDSMGVVIRTDLLDLPPIRVARPKLMRILINLVNNAADAMEASQKRQLIFTVRPYDHGQELILRDTGRGISSAQLSDIFRQGFSTKKTRSGYGLHYCATAMQEIGGSIHIESDGEGKGVTVRLQFPATLNPTASEVDQNHGHTQSPTV